MSTSIKEMLEAGVHFGHQTKYWNPQMKPYIFGARNQIHIINLDKTLPLFEEAVKFAKQTVKNKGFVLFVGAKAQASEIIAEEAKRCGMPFVDHRWLGGMLTNFETVKKSIKKLETKSELLASPEAGLSKKEILDTTREVVKLQKTIGGIAEMKGLPSAIFIVDTGVHLIAIQEAQKLGIPVIGVVDSNNSPEGVDYIIPGNDDSARAIKLYASAMADAILSAKNESVADLAKSMKVEMVEEEAGEEKKTVRRVNKSTEETTEVAE